MGLLDGTMVAGGGSGSRWPSPGVSVTVRSGDTSTSPTANPLAGYSIWFANVSADATFNQPPIECEGRLHLSSIPSGNPIVGIAFNVHPNSTVGNFTGLVLVMDYAQSKVRLLSYADQSLRDGSPTTIQEAAFTPASLTYPVYLEWANRPLSGIYGYGYVVDSAAVDIFYYEHPSGGWSIPTTDEIGSGFVWLGNSTLGLHEAVLEADWQSPYLSRCSAYGQAA